VLATGALVLVREQGGLGATARLGLAVAAVVIAVVGLAGGRTGGERSPAPGSSPVRVDAAAAPTEPAPSTTEVAP
jgi:hypothetical protein